MKTQTTTLFLTLLLFSLVNGQKAIFLHHSTGGAVYSQGQVIERIAAYNADHATSFQVDEFNYPDNPYPWDNYPYDFWNLWVNGKCHQDTAGIECLESILSRYDVVIFKHCFPGANINEDGTPDVTSGEKTIANYKLQYRALLEKFDEFPNKKFVAWTLAPQHRNATNTDQAARARVFANWVKNDWLTEENGEHPNVFIFDFFNIVAESNPTPSNGQVNCLKYEYEGDHDGSDGHPNEQANLTAGEDFANFMIQLFLGQDFTEAIPLKQHVMQVRFKAASNIISIDTQGNNSYIFSIIGTDGRCYMNRQLNGQQNLINISHLPHGVYIAHLVTSDGTGYNLKLSK